MEDSKRNGLDQDSIRPVSSLRSLFENTSGTDSTPTLLLAPRRTARFDHAQDNGQNTTRASLDIPRGPSPWSTTEPAAVIQRLGTPGPVVPRPRQLGGRSLQRPLSTTSLSVPQSPPIVTIDPPKSPSKPRPTANIQYSLPTARSRPLTPASVGPKSPLVSPMPPKRLSGLPTTESQLPISGEKAGAHESWTSQAKDAPAPTQNISRIVPPPVNRADKPKIPTKPVSIANNVNLEPLGPEVDKRISPFSTPPSSDEGERPEASVRQRPNQSRIPQAAFDHRKDSHAHPPSKYQSTQDKHCDLNPTAPLIYRSSDAPSLGFTKFTSLQSTVAEERPGLPPRRVQDQRAGAIWQVAEPSASQNIGNPRIPRHGPSISSAKQSQVTVKPVSEFLPPPKRTLTSPASNNFDPQGASFPRMDDDTAESSLQPGIDNTGSLDLGFVNQASATTDYPDASNINRRPPYCKQGMQEIDAIYDARIADICGQYVATTGHVTKAWNLMSGETVLAIGHAEKEIRVTSMAFKPGGKAREEGSRLWLGTNHGELQEIDIFTQTTVKVKMGAHERREVVKIHRHQNAMWTLDDGGKFCVWPGDNTGLPDLHRNPLSQRLPKGHTFSIVVEDTLWLATGKDIRVFRPNASESATFSVLQGPINEPGAGIITSGAVISGQLDRVYFGHADGKVTIYSTENFTCLGVVNVSAYKISALAGAGFHLWAGYSTGTIHVYDTRKRPWTTRKEWLAHSNPVVNILVDRSSLWKDGVLRVMSLGADNALRLWDGTLEDDWLNNEMQDRDIEYCTFSEVTALVVTWNAGAATPTHLRHEESDPRFFQNVLGAGSPPELLVFGFQELVDLEDKKLTAKTLFKGSKKKDPQEQEHMSRQYRAWRDYLVRCVEDAMPAKEPYHLLHTASMVGLFSCVFIKASQRNRIRNINAAEIKRGMGGLHGNKGALILRFVLDDSSMCLVNCHLAAGQTQTVHRNNDLTAILESTVLPSDQISSTSRDTYVGGGDGSMILDNEICILNGDLNYRIDTMGRDTVIKAVNANNFSKLLERDQLLVSRRRNPAFRLRAFKECPITFAPTYKYDVGSDSYDTSEKRRAPAWCDRILYRGAGKVKQMDYQRHELRVSDHRPVSGLFKMRIKTVSAEKRARVWKDSELRFLKAKERLATEAKIQYLRDVLGVPPAEAKRLL